MVPTILAVIALALAGVLVFKFTQIKGLKQDSASAQEQDQQIFDAQRAYEQKLAEQNPAIDGVAADATHNQRPFAVVVENQIDSRPQSGLSQADIVYEALAEGGITRFLAVFQSQDVKSIGPVRSARTYFNDWAQELGAIYVHVGGNSDALYYLHNGIQGVSDADQFYNGDYFTRIASRPAPHNVYTSTDLLNKLAAIHGFSTNKSYADYMFKDDQPSGPAAAAQSISINFSEPAYFVRWKYDPASNSYERYQSGSAAIDAGNGKNIYAKNVIVQRVANWPVASDTAYAISMGTRSGGSAQIFMDGSETDGTWKIVGGRTKFFDQSGNEIKFNRGEFWIEIVPPANSVVVK